TPHTTFSSLCSLFFSIIPRPPRPTLFPYTTLFRSQGAQKKPRSCSISSTISSTDFTWCVLPSRKATARSKIDRCTSFSSSGSRRSEEHTSELQSLAYLVCRLLLEKKKKQKSTSTNI